MVAVPLTCARVGFGTIARIHEDALRRLGVRTVAVIETDVARHGAVREAGLTPVAGYAEAAAMRPDFWDICTPTGCHAEVLEEISGCAPDAPVVIEKPICDHADLARLLPILERHRGGIVVNENYSSSAVTAAVVNHLTRTGLTPVKVVVEMTKHRGRDYLAGRFIDPALGAFGYEGTHLIAAVAALGDARGQDYLDGAVYDIDVDNVALTDAAGSALDGSQWDTDAAEGRVGLSRQGGAFVGYRTPGGCEVELYTSLSGIVGYPCPPYAPAAPRIEQSDAVTRYRIFRVDGTTPDGVAQQIVGFYEPLPGLDRGQGALAVYREWELAELIAPIEDDTMTRHFARILDHVAGKGPNPFPPERALRALHLLHQWAGAAGGEPGDDSDEVLGSDDSAAARARECARFRVPAGISAQRPRLRGARP
ncbi:Gfo/Idh/MocA family oxidoreductase [Spirillospora sp. NPDC049652]